MKFVLLTITGVMLTGFALWKVETECLLPTDAHSARCSLPVEFDLKTVIHRSYKGKVVLINFWDPDCACSEFAEPHVHHLVETFPDIQVISVVVTDPDSLDSGLKKASKHHLPGMIVADTNGTVRDQFGVPNAPGAVIFDRMGNLAFRGAYNLDRFSDDPNTAYAERALQALLKGIDSYAREAPFHSCKP